MQLPQISQQKLFHDHVGHPVWFGEFPRLWTYPVVKVQVTNLNQPDQCKQGEERGPDVMHLEPVRI